MVTLLMSTVSVSFSPDGKYVVSGSGAMFGSGDNSVKIWSTESGEVVRTLNGHTSAVNSVSFSPDGKYAVVSGSGAFGFGDKRENMVD